MSRTDSSFLLVAAVVPLLGCVAAAATPVVAGASAAFTGSVASSGLLGLAFTGRHLQLYRARGEVSLPAAVLSTIFGGWFMLAPLLYADVGVLSTAGVQLAGTLVSTFGTYAVVAGLTGGE